jgi:hypothetical protein
MAWLEKRTETTTQVYVVELRTRTIWERVARGKSPGRGRTRLAGEYANELAAAEAYRARLAQLEAEGYLVVDIDAGVDVSRPRSDRAPNVGSTEQKVTVDEFLQALRQNLDALPDQPRLTLVLNALDQTMRGAKRRFRSKGYACDLGLRGEARFVMKVASEHDYWREIGCKAEIRVPDEHETEEECIDSDTGSWSGFVTLVREDAAWQAVAELPCVSLTLVDDEID